jgi:PAS domain S-box-containing protein
MSISNLPLESVKSGFLDVHQRRDEEALVLGMIHRFTEHLSQQPGVKEICNYLVRVIIEETDFENCSIALWDAQKDCLTLVAAYGLDDLLGESTDIEYHHNLNFTSQDDVAIRVFASKEPAFIEDVFKNPIPSKINSVIQPGILICMPLMDLGIVNLSSSEPRTFGRQQRRSWILLTNIMGHLILEADLHEHLRERNHRLQLDADQKRAALARKSQDLLAANSFLELVINNAPQGVCLLDNDGRIFRTNHSMEKLQGEADTDLVGRSPAVFFHQPGLFEGSFRKVSTTGVEQLKDILLIRSSGQTYPADVFLNRLIDDTGKVMGHLLVIDDMTEKKTIADQLLRAEKLKALGTMAGGVAHDFNNLLSTILGNTQLLLLKIDDEENRRRLKNIEMAVHDGAHTVRRLQGFTRLDAHTTQPSVVDVRQIIDDVVELTRPRWKNALEKTAHSIQLSKQLEDQCLVAMHASDLREILTNLIFNAVEAMPEGGVLTLKTHRQDQAVLIEVGDTGVGMSEEVQTKVFDPFYTTKGISNSGLGLSVSYSLANRYGGDLRVTSKRGKGSVFTIQLPAADPQTQKPEHPETVSNKSSRKLLVIDDEIDVLNLFRDMLQVAGHQVIAAHDGRQALELIEKCDFDLVFTDLGMPDINGWDIAKKVKQCKQHIPVILVTGWGAQFEGQDLSSQGIAMVISKPLGYEKLLAAIDKSLAGDSARL